MVAVARRARRLLAVAVIAVLTACSPSAPPTSDRSSASGASQRLGAELAASIDDYFANDYNDAFRNRRALMVTVDGRTVLERYYGITSATTVNVQSVGKTIVATLVGIALDEGHLKGLDQTLPQLLPTYRSSMTPQHETITLRHLLTMTAGLPADDDESLYPQIFGSREDWVPRILAAGLIQPPGQGWVYSSAGSHLLSVIISEATGRSTLDYAREKLFTPLGISTTPAAEPVPLPENIAEYDRAGFAWPIDPKGHHIGSGGLKLTASDLSKLGRLWLGRGAWQGRQLVSADWMDEAQRQQVPTHSAQAHGYGFQQWVTSSDGHHAFAAMGYGGQLVEVVPDKRLVVVVQSSTPSDPTVPVEPGTADATSYLSLVNTLIAPVVD